MLKTLFLLAFAAAANAQVLLCTDRPATQQVQAFSGSANIGGWAVSSAAIASVSYSVDGGAPLPAQYGGSRPDVCKALPNRAGCPNVGWGATLNTAALANGSHTLVVTAADANGASSEQTISFISINFPPAQAQLANTEEYSPAIGVVDGVNDTYTLSQAPVGSVLLFWNGVKMRAGADYSIAGNVITWLDPTRFTPGDVLTANYWYLPQH